MKKLQKYRATVKEGLITNKVIIGEPKYVMDSVAEQLVMQSLVKAQSKAKLAMIDYWEDLEDDYDIKKDPTKEMIGKTKPNPKVDNTIKIDNAMKKEIQKMKDEIAKGNDLKEEEAKKKRILRK